MQLRRTLRANSVLQMLIVVAMGVLANTFAADHFARLDVTQDRIYTLSQASRFLVGQLEKPLVVKVWFTKGLETPYNNHERILVDKLEEFRAWSGGRMEIEVVDPTDNPEAQAEAQRLGVAPIQYRFQSKQRSELRQVYMGMAMLYGDRQEVLPAVTRVATIEYDLARSIKTLIDGADRKVLGFVTGHQEVNLAEETGPVETLRTQLAEGYELREVRLGGYEGVPDDVDALLLIGPKRAVDLRSQYQLDQYLMSGKPVALFLNNYRPDMRTFRAQQVVHGMEAWLGHHGLRLNRDLVIDRKSNGMLRFPVKQGNYIVQTPINYPLIPKATDLAQDDLIVKGLDSMLFPFSSSIDIAADLPDRLKARVLARASADAGRLKGVQRVDPPAFAERLPDEEIGPWPVAVVIGGEFESFFAGKSVPKAAVTPADAPPEPPIINESAPARMLVVSSADMVANNIAFVMNAVDWMVQDAALVSIRSKTVQVPSLEPIEPGTLTLLKLLNLLGPAALLLILGGIRATLRRRG